jgi:hypothetical protein
MSADATDAENANLTGAFENLTLTDRPVDPNVETCLAHLKLLFAIQSMKEDVGFSDGLWDLWDAHAGPVNPVLRGKPEKLKGKEKEPREKEEAEPSVEEKINDKNLETLSRIREKRWALFVARAVDRYETWWKSLMRMLPGRPLSEADMDKINSPAYAGFPRDTNAAMAWTEFMLPPLGQWPVSTSVSISVLSHC